jgi:hypothetical protein
MRTVMKKGKKYVAVSTVRRDGLNETMVFRCNESGKVKSWGELDVMKPSNHSQMIAEWKNKGYKVV